MEVNKSTAAALTATPAAQGDEVEPIVVPNTLWTSINPQAYGGGMAPQITHLREEELHGDHSDNGRWQMLDIIPTKADYIIDLIRLNSLWPLTSGLACCAIEMMSAATPINDMDRFNMFPFRASPETGGRAHRRRDADDQDGRAAAATVGADAGAQVVRRDGRLHRVGRPLQAQLFNG